MKRRKKNHRSMGALRHTVLGVGRARPACLDPPWRAAAWMIRLRNIDYMGGGGGCMRSLRLQLMESPATEGAWSAMDGKTIMFVPYYIDQDIIILFGPARR